MPIVRIGRLPHDAEERRRAMEAIARAVVEVLGPSAALALVAEVEEQVDDPERAPTAPTNTAA